MHDPDCALARLDPVLLAWAAGFFDGEGSTIVHESHPGYLRLTVSVPQFGGDDPPEILFRFKAAMLGLGEIGPQNDEGMWVWRSRSGEEGQAAVALLWPQIGTVKRTQAASALRRFHAQYGPGRLAPRRPRRTRPLHAIHDAATRAEFPANALVGAWLGGFLDGEGCFGLIRSESTRKNGPAWHRLRASITQRSELAGPPEVLLRVREILGFGRVERHGDPQAYKWVTEGPERVSEILSVTNGWLGSLKLDQANAALEMFSTQPRLKGNTTRCLRGHPYDRVAMRGGRLRRTCNACERHLDRRSRARLGIPPRQFKNVSRRYTF